LFLEANQIEFLHPALFKSLGKLTALNLYGNQLTDLPKNVFTPLKSLKQLYLGENRLTTIHSDSFENINKRTDIYFNDNMINAIDEKLIDDTEIDMIVLTANICSEDTILIREESKEKLIKCFENYKPRGATL
jgi:Leucine-rich repeat (LRR) protein